MSKLLCLVLYLSRSVRRKKVEDVDCWRGLNARGELDVVLINSIGHLNVGVYVKIERYDHNSKDYTQAKGYRGHKHQKCELELTNTFEKSAV